MPAHSSYSVFEHQKSELLVHLFQTKALKTPALVFVRNRETLHSLKTEASAAGLASDSISGTKKPADREQVLRELADATLDLVFATASPLRDCPPSNIATIVYFDPPELDDDYLASLDLAAQEITILLARNDHATLPRLQKLTEAALIEKIDPDFNYDKQPRHLRIKPKKGQSNRTQSKPLQNKKPKLKDKGPRRKTGRTRKR